MRNCIVRYQGGAYSRAGTAYCGMCKQDAANAGGTATSNPPRLINFQLSINKGYALEFGDQYMRILSNGAYITETAQNVTAITQANPGVITITTHGYSNGDWVFASGIGGMTNFNGLIWIVQNSTTNTFTLTDLFGNAQNTTSFPAFTTGGTFARIYTAVSPYAAIDLPYLKFTQNANLMNMVCVNQSTSTEYPPYNLQRITDTNWTFVEISIVPTIAPPSVVNSSAISSTTLSTWYSYAVTAVDTNGNESIASNNTDVQNNDISINAGSNVITWNQVVAATQYNIYAATPIYNTSNTDPGFLGVPYGLIGSAFGLQFIDTNIIPDFTTTPPQFNNPFARGTILDVTETAMGSGYTAANIGYIINTSTGIGFSGTPIVNNGAFTGFLIENGGYNYVSTDTITMTSGSSGAPAAAVGNFTFIQNPAAGQYLVFNGFQLFFSLNGGSNSVQVQNNIPNTLLALSQFLNSFSNADVDVATYTISGQSLNITYKTTGTGGNSYTLNIGTTTAIASGSTLTGGTGGSGGGSGAAAVLTVGPETGTYPGTVQYFQQRLVYANTINQPDTYFMSQPGLYTNFDASIPTIDSDAIIGTPWAVQINGIQWMIPTIQGLLTFTGNGNWMVNGGNATAITPSDENAQANSQIGCSAIVPPLYVNLHILYVQSKNSSIRDIAYNFLYNVFTGTDITVYSNHLFFGYTIEQWAYAEEPFKLIWAIRNDGVLLSLTYIKEQEIIGWARHDTNGLYVSVCTVVEPPLNENVSFVVEPPIDAVYVVVQRYIPGTNAVPAGKWVYYTERMNNRIWQNIEDCFCVDAGLFYPLTNPQATLYAAQPLLVNAIDTVTLIAGGNNYTNPIATAVDSTGVGTGATFNLSFTPNGPITSISRIQSGNNYTPGATQIIITDPTGSDAVASPTFYSPAVFTTSVDVSSQIPAGSIIRVGGSSNTVIATQPGNIIDVDVVQPITQTVPNDPTNTPLPAIAGTWSIAVPITVVGGLNHLEGMTVTGLADGGVIPQQIVTNGQITLQQAASAICVGLPFTAQVQSMYLDTPEAVTIQGRRKDIGAVTVRLDSSRGVQVGTNQPDASTQPNNIPLPWTNMKEIKERNNAITAGNAIPLFTGDYRIKVPGDWATKGQVAVQQIYPLPLGLLSVIPEFVVGDTPAP